jgi:predicted nucleotidyltransferase
MSSADGLDGFEDALQAAVKVIADLGGRGVIIGGVAVGLLSEPRFTNDVDAVILLDLAQLPRLLERAKAHGLVPRIGNPLEFAEQSRMVLLRHEQSDMAVDISLGMLPFEEEMINRARGVDTSVGPVPVPTIEDMLILKAVAHRPKDLQDVANLLHMHPNVDRQRVESWAMAFAEILEMPEIWEDLAPLLADA